MPTSKPELGQPLTAREREVMRLRGEGLTLRQTGDALFIGHRMVGFHCQNAYVKLGVHNLLAAMQAMEKPLREEN